MSLSLFSSACNKDKNTDATDTTDTSTDTAITDACSETALGDIPANAEWITLHGNSNEIFSLSDNVLGASWQGNYGTYDLNTVAFEGANGFLLSRPGTVVGARVQWSNLPTEDSPVPLYFWPDFGSDGYMWDSEHPYTIETRCLHDDSNAQWVDYVLAEPIHIPQALHMFVGYHRDEREAGTPAITPELLQENYQQTTEPFISGARFLGVDDELYYLGMASYWYTWQVELAVVYDEEIPSASKAFQETDIIHASGRVAWGDFDNDGDEDIMTGGPVLWQNNGDGTFKDVTDEAIFQNIGSGGGVWGDFNNDGCLDYFGQGGQDILLENTCNKDGNGYQLIDVTAVSQIQDLQTERDCNGDGEPEYSPTEGSAWMDVDNDGWLDLYLANYECSSDFDYFKNYDDMVWRNNGDGTFSNWTQTLNIPQINHAGRGPTSADYDQDGDIDLFVSNYRLDPNFFFENTYTENQGFRDVSGTNGTRGVQVSGAYGHTIGAVFGDIDGDLDMDMIHANLAHPFYYWFSDKSMVLVNDGNNKFTNEAEERGLYYRETHSNPTLFDADNDGDLDLFITSVYTSRDSDFYENDGNGMFTLSNYESGLVVRNGWGAASGDYDNDGDMDMLAYNMYENNASGNWLEVRTLGGVMGGPADGWTDWKGKSNIAGIGATITVETETGSILRHVSGGSGTGVQDSLVTHFGIADDTEIRNVHVLFAGGNTVTISNVEANQKIWIHEDGSYALGWSFPTEFIPAVAIDVVEGQ